MSRTLFSSSLVAATLAALTLSISTSAQAGEPRRGRVSSSGQVISAQALRPVATSPVVVTTFVVALRVCDGVPCQEQVRLNVLGGTIDGVEHTVAGLKAPKVGDTVTLGWAQDHVRVEVVNATVAARP